MAGNTRQDFLHHLINCKASRLLAGRKFLECGHELGHQGLSTQHQRNVVKHPIPIAIGGDIGELIGIGSQVKQFRHPQYDKGFGPDLAGAFASLLHEHYLPVVVAQRHQVAIITEVKELDPWALLHFTVQVWH